MLQDNKPTLHQLGVGATLEIRRIEAARFKQDAVRATRILALTGMSSLDDKRRAFDAGVDG
jgi:CheY-like chemotaxis protein